MDASTLIESTGKLKQPSAEAANEFLKKRDACAEALNERLLERDDLTRLIGQGNEEMMMDNSRNFCRFMSSLFFNYEPQVLVRTVMWVFRAYRTHGFQLTFWAAEIDVFVEIIRDELTPNTFAELYPFYNWLIVNIPAFAEMSDTQIEEFVSEHLAAGQADHGH